MKTFLVLLLLSGFAYAGEYNECGDTKEEWIKNKLAGVYCFEFKNGELVASIFEKETPKIISYGKITEKEFNEKWAIAE